MFALILFTLGFVGAAPDAATATKTEKNQVSAPAAEAKMADKKSTDMSFDEILVQGKYHFNGEAVTTVEQDKVLDGLLQVRKDFKDRIQQSAARY